MSMTENEAIEWLDKDTSPMKIHIVEMKNENPMDYINAAIRIAIEAIMVVRHYREIGTVEECRTAVERMNKSRRKLLFIIDNYGTNKQEDKTIEELSELQKAILKHRENQCAEERQAVIDEIADVSVMLEQLKIIYSCSMEVEERIDYKIDRQIQRIKKKYNIVD